MNRRPVKKVGQREADEGERRGDLVEDRVGPHRGEHADGEGDAEREKLRRADHKQRGGEPLQDQRVDIDAAREREAPVALQHRHDPAEVAHHDRVIDAEFCA